MNRRNFLAGTASVAGALATRVAHAMASTVKLVYPYTPGSGGDILARVLADDIGKRLDITALVENKPGADGRIGVRQVKYSRPDGSELLFTPFGTMVLFPTVFKDLPYDAFTDFTPVTQVVTYDFGLAVGPMANVKSLAELATWLKQNPEKGHVAVPGLGALPHLLPLKFAMDSNTRIDALAYKGTQPALTAAMAGQLPLVCAPLSDLVPQAQAGAIRVVAVSGTNRSAYLPDVPTFKEQGFDIVGSGWYGLFAPSKTPADIVAKLNGALTESIRSDEFSARARSLFLTPAPTTPAELGAIQKADFDRWAPVIHAAGLEGK